MNFQSYSSFDLQFTILGGLIFWFYYKKNNTDVAQSVKDKFQNKNLQICTQYQEPDIKGLCWTRGKWLYRKSWQTRIAILNTRIVKDAPKTLF